MRAMDGVFAAASGSSDQGRTKFGEAGVGFVNTMPLLSLRAILAQRSRAARGERGWSARV